MGLRYMMEVHWYGQILCAPMVLSAMLQPILYDTISPLYEKKCAYWIHLRIGGIITCHTHPPPRLRYIVTKAKTTSPMKLGTFFEYTEASGFEDRTSRWGIPPYSMSTLGLVFPQMPVANRCLECEWPCYLSVTCPVFLYFIMVNQMLISVFRFFEYVWFHGG